MGKPEPEEPAAEPTPAAVQHDRPDVRSNGSPKVSGTLRLQWEDRFKGVHRVLTVEVTVNDRTVGQLQGHVNEAAEIMRARLNDV